MGKLGQTAKFPANGAGNWCRSRVCSVAPALILDRCFFGVVDHEYVDHDLPGLQFEPELFL